MSTDHAAFRCAFPAKAKSFPCSNPKIPCAREKENFVKAPKALRKYEHGILGGGPIRFEGQSFDDFGQLRPLAEFNLLQKRNRHPRGETLDGNQTGWISLPAIIEFRLAVQEARLGS